MQLTEVIEHLAIATEAENKSPRTVQAYREKLSYLVRFLGDPHIETVTVHDLRRFMVAQYEKKHGKIKEGEGVEKSLGLRLSKN